ncbi:outer membrane protein assembly factor BamD [candidate division KSB1 bacterium]|nr:outer membrane protein assembly factor BamD [candidate division KSB1 bacterium]NIS26867.1 outer membrane protein assembly factor BamD [candidate division KSB1 bacterium]NIU27534.1 outer membrane protein assembly factor BamD [candidate division KSB1 bacterium]NIU94120.1 outer membrane protein assembly factor BamD [candidate division KSB1 bacterium]NIV96776.1 outer membrane protein assembly factor BamD [candidate division KSB1 bacterium]
MLLSATALFSQEPEVDLERLLRKSDPSRLRQDIRTLMDRYRGTAFEFYLDALTEADAELALKKYEQLMERFPTSRYAGDALFKVAQYYFSRGLYISARKKFVEFEKKFPRSPSIHDARYFAMASQCAIKKDDACYEELKKYLVENSRSPFTKLAKKDLNALRENIYGDKELSNGDISNGSGEYTLQIGAFSQVNNALNLKDYCKDLGLPVEVREKNLRNGTLYLVWLGAFETEEAAETFGERFKRQHGKPFRVVERY